MKIYNYDENSKVLLGSSIAQENPKNKGVYLMPPNSTTIVPPEVSENEIPVFAESYWKIVPDYRALIQINTSTHEISYVDKIGELEKDYMLYSDYINSDECKTYQEQLEKEDKYFTYLAEMQDIDNKRIRAICEPSIKDSKTGETWLEYYNKQMIELRKCIQEVGHGA